MSQLKHLLEEVHHGSLWLVVPTAPPRLLLTSCFALATLTCVACGPGNAELPDELPDTISYASCKSASTAGLSERRPGPGEIGASRDAAAGRRVIEVRWTCERHIFAKESDLWPTAWSDDGNIYAAWGDGWGFALKRLRDAKKSYGISRIDGTGVSDLSGSDLLYGPDGQGRGKISAMVSVQGTLYLMFNHQDKRGTLSLRRSTDRGRTISGPIWSESEVDVGAPVQAGRDNEAGNGFVYTIQDGGRLGDPDDIFLYRVAEAEIESKLAWATFTGMSGDEPTWGPAFPASPDRTPILSLPGADGMQVTWFEGLDRWIGLLNTGHDIADFRVLEADDLWGEWRLIKNHETDGWCSWAGTSGRTDIRKVVAPKWISEDGERFVLFASAADGSMDWDALVAVEGCFVTAGPSSPPR